MAVICALLKLLSLYDDVRFIEAYRYSDLPTLILIFACLLYEPIYCFYAVSKTDFARIEGYGKKTWCRVILVVVIEYFGLHSILSVSEKALNRRKRKNLIAAVTKSGPISVLKLTTTLQSGVTIGIPYLFTQAKSFSLFWFGVGTKLPILFPKKPQLVAISIAVYFMYFGIYVVVFWYYFGPDRTEQLDAYHFDVFPSEQHVNQIVKMEGIILGALIVISLTALGVYKLIVKGCKKHELQDGPRNVLNQH